MRCKNRGTAAGGVVVQAQILGLMTAEFAGPGVVDGRIR